jgi:hypothetical protein
MAVRRALFVHARPWLVVVLLASAALLSPTE